MQQDDAEVGELGRAQALARSSDGFELAQVDLELRGEGELTGTRQSGLARFGFARLPEDGAILERAHERAALLLRDDPGLEAPELALLAERVDAREGEPVAA